MAWLPDGINNLEDMLIHFDRMYESDRRTDTRTLHDG